MGEEVKVRYSGMPEAHVKKTTQRANKGDNMKKLLVAALILNVFTLSGCMGLMHGDHHSDHITDHHGAQQPSEDDARPSNGSHSH